MALDTPERIDAAISQAVDAERQRCVAIIQAVRCGELDRDYRSIVSMIEGGETVEQMKARDAYTA